MFKGSMVAIVTPMNEDGSCHTDIVESVVEEIDGWTNRYHKDIKPTVVIRSTVPPGTTDRLHKKYKGVDVRTKAHLLLEYIREILPIDTRLKLHLHKDKPTSDKGVNGGPWYEVLGYFANSQSKTLLPLSAKWIRKKKSFTALILPILT